MQDLGLFLVSHYEETARTEFPYEVTGAEIISQTNVNSETGEEFTVNKLDLQFTVNGKTQRGFGLLSKKSILVPGDKIDLSSVVLITLTSDKGEMLAPRYDAKKAE